MTQLKEALKETKLLHAAVQKALRGEHGGESHGGVELAEMKRVLLLANRALSSMRRQLAEEKLRGRAEVDALRVEVASELVDVAAHSARVQDRQRILFERSNALSGQAAAHERAASATAMVEASLQAICGSSVLCAPGLQRLYDTCAPAAEGLRG